MRYRAAAPSLDPRHRHRSLMLQLQPETKHSFLPWGMKALLRVWRASKMMDSSLYRTDSPASSAVGGDCGVSPRQWLVRILTFTRSKNRLALRPRLTPHRRQFLYGWIPLDPVPVGLL